MGDFGAWIGREDVRRDDLTDSLMARWCAALDRDAPADSTAPQGLHWCLCTPDAPTAAPSAQQQGPIHMVLATVREAAARTPHAMQFAVPRF